MTPPATGIAPRRWAWRAPDPDAVVQPRAAVAHGGASRRLLDRLAAMPAGHREGLRLVAAADWLVAVGDVASLPWIDGVRYAAPSAAAPGLWLPTHLAPDVDAALVQRALHRRHPRTPLLLWPVPEIVLPLDEAEPARDDTLTRLAARWGRTLRLAIEPAPAPATTDTGTAR